MGNLEYSFDNILKSYIDTGIQLTDHQVNLISTNKNMVKTYIRKRVITVNKANEGVYGNAIFSDNELELLKKYDKKSYDNYINYLLTKKRLRLDNTNLTSLPNYIGNLTKLEYFDLSFNRLTSLPDWIGNLKNLRDLNLSYNQLTSLPESIGKLTKLEIINLYGNKLEILPESIGDLTKLRVFQIESNNLKSLPESIKNLTELVKFYLDGNPLTDGEKKRVKELLNKNRNNSIIDLSHINVQNYEIN